MLIVVFSKPVTSESVGATGAFAIAPDGAVERVVLDAHSRRTANIFVREFPMSGAEVAFRLTIGTGVRDDQGRSLDQDPSSEGAQPFEQDLRLPCLMRAFEPQRRPCGRPGAQNQVAFCPDARFACRNEICVSNTCGTTPCPAGLACAPSTGLCEVDCRLYQQADVCSAPRPTCDSDLGICR
jgi:hypothetical protein